MFNITLEQPGAVLADQVRHRSFYGPSPGDVPAPVAVSARTVRLVLHWQWTPDRAEVARYLRVAGPVSVACRWLSATDQEWLLSDLQPDRQVQVLLMAGIEDTRADSGIAAQVVALVRENRPTVTVLGSNGKQLSAARWRKPYVVRQSEVDLTLDFDRPMAQSAVERALRVLALSAAAFDETDIAGAPVPLTLRWEHDRRLRVRWATAGSVRFRLYLGGLSDTAGNVTVPAELEILPARVPLQWVILNSRGARTPASPGPVLPDIFGSGWHQTQVAPDGNLLLLMQPLAFESGPLYRPWLYRMATSDLVPLDAALSAGAGYWIGLLPGGRGVISMHYRTVQRYGMDGAAQTVWQNNGVIHGAALAPMSGRLAVLAHGDGDTVRLLVLDPLAPDPARTVVDYGVVHASPIPAGGSEVSGHERMLAVWSPDETEVAFGGGRSVTTGGQCSAWQTVSYRFRFATRQLQTLPGLVAREWSPDGRFLLLVAGNPYQPDDQTVAKRCPQPGPETVIQPGGSGVAGGSTVRIPGVWRWGGSQTAPLLWRSGPASPFAWRELTGPEHPGPSGALPLGWAGGRLLTATGNPDTRP